MSMSVDAGADVQTQWAAWARKNVKSTYRKRALEGVWTALQNGQTPEEAAAAGIRAAQEARLDHYARNSTVAGAIALAVALLLGGFSILFIVISLAYARKGWDAPRNGTLARFGLAMGLLSIGVFGLTLWLRMTGRLAG